MLRAIPVHQLTNAILRCYGVSLYSIPVFAWETMRARMRIEDAIRKTVVFLGSESEQAGFVPYGTAAVGVVTIGAHAFSFLVTAKHVFDGLSNPIAVRLNRKSGECETVKWVKFAITHPDPANDIAIIPFPLRADIWDVLAERLDRHFHEQELAEKWEPGIGDEVAVVGLYTSHYGVTKNIPVVRIGHIAAMPDEPVMTGIAYAKAYLIEVKSIAGLSGSPVFVNPPQMRIVDSRVQHREGSMLVPLGMLIGYHVVESKEDQIAVPQFQTGARPVDASSPDERNTGFAVVIPIERVYDIIEAPEIRAIMEQQAQKRAKESGYRPASAEPIPRPEPNPDENPAHREDFNRLVGAASKAKPKGDQT